jgi:hypothetical protein
MHCTELAAQCWEGSPFHVKSHHHRAPLAVSHVSSPLQRIFHSVVWESRSCSTEAGRAERGCGMRVAQAQSLRHAASATSRCGQHDFVV